MLQIDVAYDAGSFAAIQLEKIWLTFQRVSEYRAPTWPDPAVLQQIHLDFAVSDLVLGESLALAAGATKMQVQPNPERWLVFMDPAGHPFCLSTLIPG
ncbi:MAG: VOC family protein [Actinomycetota bacterium]|nr:MAG: VOC family protein [Actinomycetota bacterium]